MAPLLQNRVQAFLADGLRNQQLSAIELVEGLSELGKSYAKVHSGDSVEASWIFLSERLAGVVEDFKSKFQAVQST
jgi:hypothetical protein